MTSFKKLLRTVANACLIVVVVLIVSLTLFTLASHAFGNGQLMIGGYGFGRVITGSMEPAIPTGSFIIIKKVPLQELAIGDTITFYSDDPSVPQGHPVSHQIVRVETENGSIRFITKGLANETSDPYPVRYDDIIGEVVWVSSVIGAVIALAKTPFLYPILILLLAINMAFQIVVVVHEVKQLKDQENNKTT